MVCVEKKDLIIILVGGVLCQPYIESGKTGRRNHKKFHFFDQQKWTVLVDPEM